MFQSLIDGIDQHEMLSQQASFKRPLEQSVEQPLKRANTQSIRPIKRALPRYLSDQSPPQTVQNPTNSQTIKQSINIAPCNTEFRSPPPLNSQQTMSDYESEFRSQLFVIYMPKTNFKRFIITADCINIIRAPNQAINTSKATNPPRLNWPMRQTSNPSNNQSNSASNSAAINSPPSIKSPINSALNSPINPSLKAKVNEYTYNVSMEDVLSCLDNQSIHFNRKFMWVDLIDHGARFVAAMKQSIDQEEEQTSEQTNNQSSNQAGLWYNVASKSHLVAHQFQHPILGEGYAVVITLDLLDEQANNQSNNQSEQSISSMMNQPHELSPMQSNKQSIDLTEEKELPSNQSISESITSNNQSPTTQSTNQELLNEIDSPVNDSESDTDTDDHVDQSIKQGAESVGQSGKQAGSQSQSSKAKKKIRPVETIGEMLDRVVEYQNVRARVQSKNAACRLIGYSKGTINSYREKIKAAINLSIDLASLRSTKYREFRRVLIAAQKVQGQQHNPTINQAINQSVSTKLRAARREEKMRARSNSFGDIQAYINQASNQGNQSNNQPSGNEVMKVEFATNQSSNQSTNQAQTPEETVRFIQVNPSMNHGTYYSTPALLNVNDRASINQVNNQPSISVVPLTGPILSYPSSAQSINQSNEQPSPQQTTHYLAYTTNPSVNSSINQSINQSNGSYVFSQPSYPFYSTAFNQVYTSVQSNVSGSH